VETLGPEPLIEHRDEHYVCSENSLELFCSFAKLAQTLICCCCCCKRIRCYWHIKFVTTLQLGDWLTTGGKIGLLAAVWP